MKRSRRAFTLIELLVVIAIIGILVGLLLPAVQMVREAGRRTECSNHLKQIALGMTHYEGTYKAFPPGYTFPEMSMWSAYILPQIEQNNLYDTIDLKGPWTTAGTPNYDACATYIGLYQCPSARVPQHLNAQGINNRVPSTYLACASGLNNRESGALPYVGEPTSDGIFFRNSRTRTADITDGLSTTVLVGEALFDFDVWGTDYSNGLEVVDHWYIGTEQFGPEYPEHVPDISTEVSEALASTACPLNSTLIENAPINDKELCFSSHHSGGAQIAFADGHVRWVSASVNRVVWSAVGSRNGRELDTTID